MELFSRFVPSCEVIPFPFGIAHRVCSRDGAMCYWVPLNLLVRWATSFWYWLAIPRKFTARENLEAARFVIGRLEAENELLRTKLEVEAEGKTSLERSYIRALTLYESTRIELNKFLSGEKTA